MDNDAATRLSYVRDMYAVPHQLGPVRMRRIADVVIASGLLAIILPLLLLIALLIKCESTGPIFETKLKVMKWAPQGLQRVRQWKERIRPLPLVAIGGITPQRAAGVLAAGADSLAVITDFYTHANPTERVREWLALAGTQTSQQA